MGWKTRIVGFLASISALCSYGGAVHERTEDSRPSTPCGNDPANDRFLMLVSTLDGQFSALDIRNKGQLLWNVNADTRPLLSSSISKVEYKKDGSQVRLIPALDGALFQYDGESIEAVPFTAEKLLSKTFRLNDKMMIIGGKEICSYGINVATGKLQYACTANACHTFDDDNVADDEDIVVVTRNTKTVRAVDSRTGAESWNFSVGQHEVMFLKGETNKIENESTDDDGINIYTCPPSATELDDDEEERRIKVVVPDGLIVSLNPDNAKDLEWKYKFTSPIAAAWLLHQGELKQINLFSDTNVPALSSYQPADEIQMEPLLYVGMHMNQPYVQSSSQMQADISEAADSFGDSFGTIDIPRISWKPYLSTAPSRTPLLSGNREPDMPMVDKDKNRANRNDNALVIRQENYPFDQGYYLFPDYTPARRNQMLMMDNSTKTVMNNYMPVLVWMWWKQILATSIVMTVIIHVVLTHYIWKEKIKDIKSTHSSENATAQTTLYKVESETSINQDKIETARQDSDYVSRYQSDFEHIQCLGKGGFGVVFQAKNKVDDCHYAVKRIPIPCSESSKEKVMREVKVLAKLENVGIVRFFHAWVESPPPGWQEERDQDMEDSECLMPTPCNSGEAYSNDVVKLQPNIGNPFRPFELENSNFNINNTKGHNFSSNNSASGSFSFSQDNLENDESGSFSFGTSSHQNPLSYDNEDSFQIHFNHSTADESLSWSPNDQDMRIPFSNNDESVLRNNDSVNIFLLDDSGCADKCNDDESIVFQTDNSASHNDRPTNPWVQGQNTQSHVINSSLAIYSTANGRQRSHLPEKDIAFAPKLYLFIQMQLCRRETLKDWLSANTLNRPRAHVFDIFDQIVNAVTYVHDLGLMHRDLKPSNIFFSAEGVIKVGDFGLVTALTEEEDHDSSSRPRNVYRNHTDQVGTQLYMSTEQIAGKVYTSKVDIFSLGMILFELLYPFATQMERIDTLVRVKRSKLPDRFCREMPMEADCVLWLVSPDPSDRPTASQIQESDLLAQFEQRHRVANRFRTVSSSSTGSSEI